VKIFIHRSVRSADQCPCLHFVTISDAQQFMSTPTPPIPPYTLSLHDALPILISTNSSGSRSTPSPRAMDGRWMVALVDPPMALRSEEHTSELQSRFDIVCRLLLEKKNNKLIQTRPPSGQ